ncbi:MAG: PAS domain S-box protein, partial [Myxococcales bacterium]|nr:PAS domain S-box protein [Myxococcales bacterium]
RGEGERRERPDAAGAIGADAFAIDRDVARLRSALDEAREGREQLEAVLAAMVEGVLVLDEDGHIALANRGLREMLGVWGDVDGRRPLEVIRSAEVDAALREASRSESFVVRELARVGSDERTLLMHAARVPATGPRVGTVAVFRDVSEVRRLEQVRRDFIANASHELRTPLTSILGFADTLLANADAHPEIAGALQAIVRNARRLGELVEDLLELSRIESRKEPIRASEIDVARICETLVEDCEPRLRERRVELSLDVETPLVAWADARAVERVVANLLDNAIKYTEPGGHIRVRARRGPRMLSIAVEDDGIGIPKEDLARIFERFYRVDKARARALGGTGLGLSIVKHLVHAMAGDIRVDSEPGRGSTFTFTLPCAPPDAARGGA